MKKSSFAYLMCALMLVSFSSFFCQGCMVAVPEHQKASIVLANGNMVTGWGVETTVDGMVTYYKSKEDWESKKGKVSIPKEKVSSITDLKTE